MDPANSLPCLEDGTSGFYRSQVSLDYTVTDYFFNMLYKGSTRTPADHDVVCIAGLLFMDATLLSDKTHVKYTLSMRDTLANRVWMTLVNVFLSGMPCHSETSGLVPNIFFKGKSGKKMKLVFSESE